MGGLPHPDGKSRELVTVFSLGRVLQKNIDLGTDGVREVTGGSSPSGEGRGGRNAKFILMALVRTAGCQLL